MHWIVFIRRVLCDTIVGVNKSCLTCLLLQWALIDFLSSNQKEFSSVASTHVSKIFLLSWNASVFLGKSWLLLQDPHPWMLQEELELVWWQKTDQLIVDLSPQEEIFWCDCPPLAQIQELTGGFLSTIKTEFSMCEVLANRFDFTMG